MKKCFAKNSVVSQNIKNAFSILVLELKPTTIAGWRFLKFKKNSKSLHPTVQYSHVMDGLGTVQYSHVMDSLGTVQNSHVMDGLGLSSTVMPCLARGLSGTAFPLVALGLSTMSKRVEGNLNLYLQFTKWPSGNLRQNLKRHFYILSNCRGRRVFV